MEPLSALDSGRRSSILVVDDYEDSREMYAEYLRYKGHLVETANNGLDAVKQAVAKSPDAIVLELRLPGIDGFEAMRLLRADEKTAKTFIVVVTAHGLMGMEEQVRKAGADVFLMKPCLPEDLAAVIAERQRPAKAASALLSRSFAFTATTPTL